MEQLIDAVPLKLREKFLEIVAITDTFCEQHLNEEYRDLCREVAVALCQKGSPVTQGKPLSWAAGIVYSVGWVNFLTDPHQTPHRKADEIAQTMGVSSATMHSKARVIREGLDLRRFDPDFTLPSKLIDNPLVWMVEVNGLILDLRELPREVQEQAFEQGLIPFIPDDQPNQPEDRRLRRKPR